MLPSLVGRDGRSSSGSDSMFNIGVTLHLGDAKGQNTRIGGKDTKSVLFVPIYCADQPPISSIPFLWDRLWFTINIMNVSHYDWADTFRVCYEKAVSLYRLGNRQAASFFRAEEIHFLTSIGHTPQEVYDFAEDWVCNEAPSFSTALLIAAVRRDFFMVVQHGKPSGRVIPESAFPARDAELAGFRWLPRIIAKARAKLHGELPAELMYGCGGDRAFLRSAHIHLADFLRVVWSARDDERKICAYVKQCRDAEL